jgi:hypothetical protein
MIIEVKCNSTFVLYDHQISDMSLEAAKEQLGEYLGSLVDKHSFSDGGPLFGLLVVGKDDLLASSPLHDIMGDTVHNFIRKITVANW